MTDALDAAETGWASRLRQRRRGLVKLAGKRLIRRLGAFLGRQSRVGDRPVFDAADFPWARALERAAPAIRRELDGVLAHAAALPSFHEISPDQARISQGDAWKAFVLFGFGYKAEANCRLCPETTRVLEGVPGLRTAFFSILAPGYHIPQHSGVTKGVLRGHLCLIAPRDWQACRMRVGDRRVAWREGRCIVFDDSYPHEVLNGTDERRVVLLVDVDRPMRWPGRVVHRTFMAAIRWSAYVQDARRNVATSEARLAAAVARAEAWTVPDDAAPDAAERPRP